MTNGIKSLILLVALSFAAQLSAQSAGALWAGSRSTDPNAQAVHAFITSSYEAFNQGNNDNGWSAYSEEAAEISPDGNITFGKKALLEGWDAFMKMADTTPQFKYENVLVRMLTNDVALVVWDSEADIKIGGQQMGGKAKGMAVARKIKGQWKLEFDSITPMLGMPALDAASGN